MTRRHGFPGHRVPASPSIWQEQATVVGCFGFASPQRQGLGLFQSMGPWTCVFGPIT